MKQYYLVTQITKFVDPHGSADFGGKIKFVSDNPIFGKVVESDHFFYEIDEYDIEEAEEEKVNMNHIHAEDGYNCSVYNYKVKTISEKEAEEYSRVIKQYNEL